jgi:nucleotidyltransferase/DNA polymerase involved in DNA repair
VKLLAEACRRVGDSPAAADAYKRATTLDARFDDGFIALGELCVQLKRDLDAVVALQAALRFAPDAPGVQKLLGGALLRMERYAEISEKIHAIFEKFTPIVESVSLDEAFLDVTGSIKLFGGAEKIAVAIKNDVKEETGLTASVGVAPNKLLAKIASDLKKPDGLVIITEKNKQEILDPLPVGKLWRRQSDRKAASCGHIYDRAVAQKYRQLKAIGVICQQLRAGGIDQSEVELHRAAKRFDRADFEADTDGKIFIGVLLRLNSCREASDSIKHDLR